MSGSHLLPPGYCGQYEHDERFTQEKRKKIMASRFSTLETNMEPNMAIYIGMPFWNLASPIISYTIKDQFASKAACTPHELKIATSEMLDKYKNTLTIYTDGSCIPSKNTVSCAFYIPSLKYGKAFRLSPVSIFRAELTAIKMALEWVLINKPKNPVLILSDSLSSLQALDNKIKSVLIHDILHKITHLKKRWNCYIPRMGPVPLWC